MMVARERRGAMRLCLLSELCPYKKCGQRRECDAYGPQSIARGLGVGGGLSAFNGNEGCRPDMDAGGASSCSRLTAERILPIRLTDHPQ